LHIPPKLTKNHIEGVFPVCLYIFSYEATASLVKPINRGVDQT